MPDLDSEAIDFRAASELFAPIRRLRRTDVQTLRLVTSHQGRQVPTIGGLLMFGRELVASSGSSRRSYFAQQHTRSRPAVRVPRCHDAVAHVCLRIGHAAITLTSEDCWISMICDPRLPPSARASKSD